MKTSLRGLGNLVAEILRHVEIASYSRNLAGMFLHNSALQILLPSTKYIHCASSTRVLSLTFYLMLRKSSGKLAMQLLMDKSSSVQYEKKLFQ